MVMGQKWIDTRRITFENGYRDEEIPKAGKNRRSSGKSRIRLGVSFDVPP